MSPSKTPGSSTYRFNRFVRGIGRIVNSSGTTKRPEFRYRDGLLQRLIRLGALDTLRLFKRGTLTINDLIAADREGRLERVGEQLRLEKPLAAAVEAWLPDSARAPQSRRRYRVSWHHFWTVAQASGQVRVAAAVRDLAGVDFHRLRRAWGTSDADWNRTRAMLSAFLSRFLGAKQHPFRYEVLAQFPRGQEPPGRVPELDAADFWAIVKQAPDYVQPAYVAMAVLGVGMGEYLALDERHLRPLRLTVRVPGTKAQLRDREVAVDKRLWPWIARAVPAPLQARWLRIWWTRACVAAERPVIRLYDLRHLSAQLAGDQGASDRDLAVHLGHTNPTMSFRYSRRRIARRVAGAIGDALA